jgi:very-short-patch-repair endonuclease
VWKEIARAEWLIARIAANQHGVISVEQLVGAGLSPATIHRRVRAGRLHAVYRGVYAVGHTNLSEKGMLMAAVLACGEGAVVSHEAAAYLWSFSPHCPPFVHVTVPSYAGRAKREGIVLHRSSTLTKNDVTRRHNIPVTKPGRTRSDLGWDREPTRSELERAFLRLIGRADLPKPEVNAKVGPYRVDFLWRTDRVVVETDGFAHHSSRASFESDRARDRELQRRGFVVLRFTYREVTNEPGSVVASLRAHVARPAA